MANEPTPSLDLGHEHLLGLHVVGTIGLPAHPSGGRIFVVRYPAQAGGSPRFFIKIVQRLSDSHTITHFVAQEHVRLIKFQGAPAEGAGKAVQPSTLTGDELIKEAAMIDWAKFIKDDRCTYEIEIRPSQTGIVLVSEATPVVLRTESTIPAATSLEATTYPGGFGCPKSEIAFGCPRSGRCN